MRGLSASGNKRPADPAPRRRTAPRHHPECTRLRPEQIGCINAHGSSTPANDAHECHQLARVFGDCIKRIPISGTKAYTGHTLGAAGAIEAAICLLVMQNNWLPPPFISPTPTPP